jgi:serine/threonine protein phosphatase PrpC
MALRFSTIAGTDVGLIRDGNEDAALTSSVLVAVADGMGGHAGGEVASHIAINTLAGLIDLLADSTLDPESRADLLMNISYSVDSEIAARVKEEPALTGMGTTLTALYAVAGGVELLHIGDSRCYHWNGKKLQQLSYDHTVMQELIDQGRLTLDEVADHPQRSMLTQALMGEGNIDPVLSFYPAKAGDFFLLCSDGLTNLLSDHEIAAVIKHYSARENQNADLVAALIAAVKEKGAPDNVTVLWSRLDDSNEELAISPELFGAAGDR